MAPQRLLGLGGDDRDPCLSRSVPQHHRCLYPASTTGRHRHVHHPEIALVAQGPVFEKPDDNLPPPPTGWWEEIPSFCGLGGHQIPAPPGPPFPHLQKRCIHAIHRWGKHYE